MSKTTRAPPPVDGGLPSLGLLSLKETRVKELEQQVAKLWNSIEDGLISMEKDPVAAKASVLVDELEFEGEEDEWGSIDAEDVSSGRLYKGDGRERENIELWEEKYEKTDAEQVPFIWKNICDILQKKASNRPWRAFYGDKEYTPEFLEAASQDPKHAWKGWSEFSPAYNKLSPNAADVYYTKAHYLADPNLNQELTELIKSDGNLSKAFVGGYPNADADAMVDTHCEPLFQWILDCAIRGDVAEHDKKTKNNIVETFKTQLRKLLKAKEALATLQKDNVDIEAIQAEKTKISEAVNELTDVFDDFKGTPNVKACPLPPGCLLHEHLRSGGTVKAVKGNTFAEKKYVGVRYNDWGKLITNPPGQGERHGFYATGAPIPAWFVFLGHSTTGSQLANRRKIRNSRGTDRYEKAQTIKKQRADAKPPKKRGRGAAGGDDEVDLNELQRDAEANDAAREITDGAVEEWMQENRGVNGEFHSEYMALVGTADNEAAKKEAVREFLRELRELQRQEETLTPLSS
tara:strand:- start:2700 stop:4253 length:1554 start_codon:yes stop_codon:yes gene_type:complete